MIEKTLFPDALYWNLFKNVDRVGYLFYRRSTMNHFDQDIGFKVL